jgi:membrane peptidoglycan carboxypeptidase
VRTTLDPEVQALAEKAVENVLAKQGPRAKASQAALVAMRPNGAVVAMVGGRDYRASQFNRATEANRHPGSAFKVFVYLAALRKGYSPHDVIDAGPLAIKNWRPENFGGARYGHVTLADGLARSINTAAVRLAIDVGLNNVIKAARDLGIDAPMQAVPSLALGAVEVSPLDLTGAFASLRAGRTGLEPWGIAAFGDEDEPSMHTAGPPIARSAQSLGSVHRPMVDMLRRVVEQGTGRGASVGGFAAGKTGTSQNHRDAWFVGFTDSLVVGVWVGNDDNTPMRGVVGGTLPASIWRQFVREATPLLESDETQVADVPALAASPEGSACDVQVCAGRYRSFRASDCTYQPYSGERRVCEAGDSGFASAASERNTREETTASTSEATSAFAQARCDVDVCARRYRSFNAADCTYQPYGGGARQTCDAGGNASAAAQSANQGARRPIEEPRRFGWGPDGWWSGDRRRDRGYGGWRW